MKVDKKVLRRVVKVLINKVPKEEEKLLKIVRDLELISELYRKSSDFRNVLINPSIDAELKVKILKEVFNKYGIDEMAQEAVIYLSKIGKGNVVKELGKAFRFEVEKFFATVQGEMITAYPLEEKEIEEIKERIEKKIGKKVELEIKEDPSLIGGFLVKAGSYVLDASVRFYMKKLQQQLTQV